MSDEAVYRTAPATPGLLNNINYFCAMTHIILSQNFFKAMFKSK